MPKRVFGLTEDFDTVSRGDHGQVWMSSLIHINGTAVSCRVQNDGEFSEPFNQIGLFDGTNTVQHNVFSGFTGS